MSNLDIPLNVCKEKKEKNEINATHIHVIHHAIRPWKMKHAASIIFVSARLNYCNKSVRLWKTLLLIFIAHKSTLTHTNDPHKIQSAEESFCLVVGVIWVPQKASWCMIRWKSSTITLFHIVSLLYSQKEFCWFLQGHMLRVTIQHLSCTFSLYFDKQYNPTFPLLLLWAIH